LPELQALTMEFPQLPRAWTNLGRAYVLNGRLDQAGECFNKALALDARDGYTVLQVALLSWERGNVKGAEALFRRAARGLGRRPSPHATRARRVYETGAVVSDDILPPGLLESCQVSAKDYQAGAMGTPGLPRNR
jgi:tetratricopeptide (TPR) repeat protein